MAEIIDRDAVERAARAFVDRVRAATSEDTLADFDEEHDLLIESLAVIDRLCTTAPEPPASVVERVERVARALDPKAWRLYDDPRYAHLPEQARTGVIGRSLDQARAALAAARADAPSVTGEQVERAASAGAAAIGEGDGRIGGTGAVHPSYIAFTVASLQSLGITVEGGAYRG